MKNYLPVLLFLAFTGFTTQSFALTTTVQTGNAGCTSAIGYAKVIPSGGNGVYTYQWSNGATTDSIGGLTAGTYAYTVTSGTTDTVYFQDFEGAHGWTLNQSFGSNGPLHNRWVVSNGEGGQPVGSCGQTGVGDKTMFVTNQIGVPGATYDDEGSTCGGIANANTNMSAISPQINTMGKSNMTLTFEYIGGGVGFSDNASLYFSVGGNSTTLSPSLKSNSCGSSEGLWTRATFLLPSNCNNVTNLIIAFKWTNDGNCSTGTDPSVAINNVLISTPSANSNIISGSATVGGGSNIGIDLTNMAVTQPSCNSSNGTVTGIDGKNGTRAYSFQWDSAGIIKSTVAGLYNVYAGNYHLHIADQNGCTFDSTFTLNTIGVPQLSNVTDTVCQGDSITITATGITSGTFMWTGIGLPPSNTNSITFHPRNSVFCKMNWFSGNCFVSDSVFVFVRPQPTLLVTPTNPTICSGDTAVLTASGGGGGVYTWSGGDLVGSSTNNPLNVHPIANQTYRLNWTDNYCHASATASVSINTVGATVQVTSTRDTVCAGSSVILTAQASSAGGVYTWTGGDLASSSTGQTLTRTPLTNQNYIVNWVKGGCSGASIHNIHVTNINLSLTTIQQPSCGQSNGAIHITVTGIGGRAQLQWYKNGSPFQSGASSLDNLSPGTYSFIVSDQSSTCTDSITMIVLHDTSAHAVVSNIQITNPHCFGDATGTATVTVTGGSGHYFYSWSNNTNNNTNTASNLSKGVRYVFAISDGVCPPFDTLITVGGPITPITVNTSMVNDTCGHGVGAITANAAGGTAGYTYLWSAGTANGNRVTGLTGLQRYQFTVTDGNGCKDTASAFVGMTGTAPINYTADSICDGNANGSIHLTPVSNNGPFTYDWAFDPSLHGNMATGLAPGIYPVTVTDKGGCPTAIQPILPSFNAGVISMIHDTAIYQGQTIVLKANNNLNHYTANWTPYVQTLGDGSTAILDPVESTKYTVSFVYGAGCSVSESVQVTIIKEAPEVIVPNIFTPNGDGVNDFFYVTYKGIRTMRTEIFDRWGNKVFEASEPNFKWDGNDHTSGNKAMSTAVFSYVIEYTTYSNPDKKILSGNLTLIK